MILQFAVLLDRAAAAVILVDGDCLPLLATTALFDLPSECGSEKKDNTNNNDRGRNYYGTDYLHVVSFWPRMINGVTDGLRVMVLHWRTASSSSTHHFENQQRRTTTARTSRNLTVNRYDQDTIELATLCKRFEHDNKEKTKCFQKLSPLLASRSSWSYSSSMRLHSSSRRRRQHPPLPCSWVEKLRRKLSRRYVTQPVLVWWIVRRHY